jgi:formylglycine-generating enzyme required for sulfatase activity
MRGDALPRLFISHSSKDNIHALAFQRWLELKGWSRDDVFIDLHDMEAGEKWQETLVKANVACEALLFLASPDSLGSDECRREVRRAEDDRKDVIVAILRDVTVDDPRLADYKDRQVMDLSTNPREERVEVEHRGQRYLIDFNRAALNAIHAKLIDWGIAPDAFAWPPRHNPKALPYPGLDAFDEHSTGIFFGREADVMAGIRDLRQIRHRGSPRLLVIQAASGAGKSSFLRAGLWPRLGRTSEFVPLAIVRPATGIITGKDGLGQGLSQWLGEHRRQTAAGTIHGELMDGEAADGARRLAARMSEAVSIAAEELALNLEEGQAPPRLSPLIAIDQGEELFATEGATQSNRFLDMMGHLLRSPPAGLDPYVLITIRADSVNALLDCMPTLGLVTPQTIMLPPLSRAAYRDVITKPAAVYSRQVARLDLEPELVEALEKGASGADALPLLAFTLQRLFLDYAPAQTLTRAHYSAMGGIEGSIDRKLADAKAEAGTAGTDANLRRLIVPALATWDEVANAAKRLVPKEADVVAGDRAGLAPLANALVEARLLTRDGGTLEVAHEALLRREPVAGWLEQVKDALKLRDDVLREAKEWADGGKHDEGLVRRGARLESALDLAGNEDFSAELAPARDYLVASQGLEEAGKRRARRAQALTYALLLGIIAGLVAFINQEAIKARYQIAQTFLNERYQVAQESLKELYHWRMVMRSSVLSAEQEKGAAGTPGSEFTECANGCPKMIVVPAGEVPTGPPGTEGGEWLPKMIVIAKPFAVGQTTVTFAQWDVCVAAGACPQVSDNGWGRGDRPVMSVSWEDAKGYVAWLTRMTGKEYRLLTEPEWEHAARAGNKQPHWFGDKAAKLREYAWFMRNAKGKTEPVGKKKPNGFGLYDMLGNVWQWLEDCHYESARNAWEKLEWAEETDDEDASPRMKKSAQVAERKPSQLAEKKPPRLAEKSPQDGVCASGRRAVRGGSWHMDPRSPFADRSGVYPDIRSVTLGFRVARTLNP